MGNKSNSLIKERIKVKTLSSQVPSVKFGLFGFFNAASGLIVVVPLIESGKGRSVVVVVVPLKVSVPLKG